MATVINNQTWLERATVQTVSENLVTEVFAIEQAVAAAANAVITELPFGSTMIACSVNAKTATDAAAILSVGVYASDDFDGTDLAGSATGYDVDGLAVTTTLAVAGHQAGAGALLGIKLDETVFTGADQFGEPLIVGASVATQDIDASADVRIVLTYKLP